MKKRRLLLVIDAVGGVWVYSLELARALHSLGIEAIIAVTGPSPGADQREAAAGLKLIDTGLPLEWLAGSADDIAAASLALAEIAEREAVDLVQTSSAAHLAQADFHCPCIAVQHSCVTTWWAAVQGGPLPTEFVWQRDLVQRGLERADAVVAPSFAFAAATQDAYDLDGPVLAVHNGRSAREHRPLPQGDFAFTAGRLWDEGKNAATLDRAAARIDAPLQAAGSGTGPNGASVALEHLTVLGQLSEARLRGVLAARPVFVSAALYEPFGLSVLEAAQGGCALVLSDIASHRELWEGAAIFVPPRDDAGFAAAIDDLLRDRDERDRLGQLARARARHFSPQRMAAQMTDIYERVLAPHPQLAGRAA